MKFLIGLALLSMAFASPAVQPVELPEAPQPAIEDGAPEAIELPAAAIPEFEMQAPSILPLFIPQEISRMLNDLGEIRDDVQVADGEASDAVYAEDAEMAPEEPSPVNFVDNDQDVFEMAPEEPSPVNFVDNDQDVFEMAPEEPSPLNFVDNYQDVFEKAPEEPSPLNFVDNDQDVFEMAPEEPSPLNFVDNAEDVFDDGPEEPSPINFVENAEAPEEIPISPVLVVDGPLETEVMGEPYEGSPLNFVDNAENPEEIPYSPVMIVDGPNMFFAEEEHAKANNNMEAFLIQMAKAFDALRQKDDFMAPPGNPANRFPDQPMLRMR